MCKDCGCGEPGPTRIDGVPAEEVASPLTDPAGGAHRHGHTHAHDHDHDHTGPHDHTHPPGELPAPGGVHRHPHTHYHSHPHPHTHGADGDHSHGDPQHPHGGDVPVEGARTLQLHEPILAANERLAERNRGFFSALGLVALNLVSAPGSGKTELVRQTITRLQGRLRVGVIVGDLATDNDARRLRETGAPVVQITTGTMCHLDAGMIARALGRLDPKSLDLLVIENVGNLVCPSAFDLGESVRVALLSVTEGEDKPLKYPPLFNSSGVVVVTKIDLAGAVGYDRDTAFRNLRRVTPGARIFELSARTGEGMESWCDYLAGLRPSPAT